MSADFRWLWAGETVSLLGSQVTLLALPLTAVLTLHASPFQMGLLAVAGSVPTFLFSLPAGAWVDRQRRRPVLAAANVGRALVLLTIPIAAWRRVLTLPHLAVAAFLAGTLTIIFQVAYQSYLPALMSRDDLVRANGRLEASASLAQLTGPSLAGGLIQLVTAPIAILADALSFTAAALFLRSIRATEAPPAGRSRRSLRVEVGEGLRTVLGHETLRALAAAAGIFNLFDSVLLAVYVLYMTRTLGIAAGAVGLVFALGAVGGLAGSFTVQRITLRLGLRRTLQTGVGLAALAELGIALVHGSPVAVFGTLALLEMGVELGATLFGINALSLRQAIVPPDLQGRVNATISFISGGLAPLGFILGGILGESVGLRDTVLVAGGGTLLAVPLLIFSCASSSW